MANRLSQDQIDSFSREGYLFPIRALETQEAAAALARLEAMEAERDGRLPPLFNAKPHLLMPWLWDIVHDARIVDCVEDLLGPDLLCLGTSFISKRPMDQRYVAWHQDVTYWGLASPEAVTAWVALTPSAPQNGCVRAIPGTHLKTLAHTDSGDGANLLGRGEKMVDEVEEQRAIDFTLAPGEMSVHHCLVAHGSAANHSDMRRVGFAIRYVPGRVAQKPGAHNTATLVRGRDCGNFELEQAPEGEFHPEAVRRHTAIFRRGMKVIFDGAPNRRQSDADRA